MSTYEDGSPADIAFSGFSPVSYQYIHLEEGVWGTGVITFDDTMQYGCSFIVPSDCVLKKIYVVYATAYEWAFADGASIRPFVCIGVASPESAVLSYTIIPETMTFTDAYAGGTPYPKHELRWGSLTNLNVPLQEGALVGIIGGIFAENIDSGAYGMFVLSGGLLLE